MEYATLDGLMEYALAHEWQMLLKTLEGEDEVRRALEEVETQLLAYIVPCSPVTDMQKKLFCRACYIQTIYEYSTRNAQLADMPDGVTSFSVNGFSASFGSASKDSLFRYGIAKPARSALMLAGLLYKGVETC